MPNELEIFCPTCKEFTKIRAIYDSVEVWTLVREYNPKTGCPFIELGTMIENGEVVGVREFVCMECSEPVMENGECVESEERLLYIIDHQFME